MILVDTSAWVEYLRGTGSSTHHRLRSLISEGVPLATTDPVRMEILCGARDEPHAEQLRRMLNALDHHGVLGADFDEAARIHRDCRMGGKAVRSLMDCLIAAVALRDGMSVLARDRDFDAIRGLTGL
ncbi:MAG: PIN domain nuclease, partial [Gemmatimonadales bacterium]